MGNVPVHAVALASHVPATCRARAAAVSPSPHAETGQCPSVRVRWEPFAPNRPFQPSP
jgi:hypothetical protein